MSVETLKIKVHHKFLEDLQMAADKNNMLLDQYILYCLQKMAEEYRNN